MTIFGLSRRGRIAVLLGLAAVAIPAEALLLPDVLDRRPLCVRAEEWVEAHKGALPQFYDQVVSYPMAHRRAIFGNLTPEARSALWRENLRRFAIGRELTAEQQGYLDHAAKDVVTAENYGRGGPGLDALREEADKITALFPDDADRRAFTRLGPEEPRLATFEGARLALAQRLQAAVVLGASNAGQGAANGGGTKAYGTCTCNVENAGWFPIECYGGIFNCAYVGCAVFQACGPFGFLNCTGCCCYWRDETVCDCGTPY